MKSMLLGERWLANESILFCIHIAIRLISPKLKTPRLNLHSLGRSPHALPSKRAFLYLRLG